MSDEQMRAEFEAWAAGSYSLGKHENGTYVNANTRSAWYVWQAARAQSAEVEPVGELIVFDEETHPAFATNKNACKLPTGDYPLYLHLPAREQVERWKVIAHDQAETISDLQEDVHYWRQKAREQVPDGSAVIPLDPRNGKPLITNEMKKTHIGEYEFAFPSVDEDGEEIMQSVTVPWDLCKTLYKAMAQTAMLAAAPQPQPDWTPCSQRLPTEADADCHGEVWTFNTVRQRVETANWYSVRSFEDGIFRVWKPTGLTRPQPPEE